MTDTQRAPRAYELFMQIKLDMYEAGDVSIESFGVDTAETAKRIEKSIADMETNKAAVGK